jgi:hypothetical protein
MSTVDGQFLWFLSPLVGWHFRLPTWDRADLAMHRTVAQEIAAIIGGEEPDGTVRA